MDTAMRDLEQIQERHPEDGTGRKLGMIAVATVATVGLVFAMGVLVGNASEEEVETVEDPLAALDRAAGLAAADPVEPAPAEVDREELTFHAALVDDGRPEVAAALAAAEAEIAHLDPLPGTLSTPMMAAAPMEAAMPAIPAAVAAGPDNEVFTRTLEADPMAAALRPAAASEPPRPRASAGSDGEYTLQVISYRSEAEAETFADALRTRGHESFVVSADVPGRGRYYRVRIGPFESMAEAERYRSTFEQDERMNTFVVRRRDEG